MKLQGMSIVFGLIMVPIILVLSYYIGLQIDTITKQTSYDTKLLDATHDAMAAFELNTANEDLSSVADSLRTIIDASTNIFFNTLATNLGLSNASKSYIEPFIPAILYTLYDGYYINSPTRVPVVMTNDEGVALTVGDKGVITGHDSKGNACYKYDGTKDTNGSYSKGGTAISGDNHKADYGQILYKIKGEDNAYTVNMNPSNIEFETKNVLKSYMPYSARYVHKNAIVNNVFHQAYSEPQDIDVTINYTLDNYITVVGNIGDIYYTKSGYLIKKDSVKFKNNTTLIHQNENDAENFILENKDGVEIEVTENGSTYTLNSKYSEEEKSAVIYYAKAIIFSNWVYDNLGELKESDIILSQEMRDNYKSLNTSDEIINFFDRSNIIFNGEQNPEDDSSDFVEHKYQVIQNSIQYNLNLAMSTYNNETANSYDFNMPIITSEEWDKIVSEISIVSFMQGLNCGLKPYNNYAIVSSTNNELTVIPSEIYYVVSNSATPGSYNENNFNDGSEAYHRIDCPKLKEKWDSLKYDDNNMNISESRYITSFKSKEVKYDKILDKNEKYIYDHQNLACYTCIVDGNYTPEDVPDDIYKYKVIAVGKERYNLYKTNAIKYSEGYEVIFDRNRPGLDKSSSRTISDIKALEITVRNVDAGEGTIYTFQSYNDKVYTLNREQSTSQTITITIDAINTSDKVSINDNIEGLSNYSWIQSINVIYK